MNEYFERLKDKVRPLTYKEVRGFLDQGIRFNALTVENADDALVKTLETQFTPEEVGRLPYPEALKLFREILRATFVSDSDLKNSSTPGGGGPKADQNTAGPAENGTSAGAEGSNVKTAWPEPQIS